MTHTINNFFEYSSLLSAGGQPSESDLDFLQKAGYEVIVNISPVSTKNYLTNEATIVEKLAMDYIHFPIDCSKLRPIHYLVFSGILKNIANKKVFVHCGGNIKSSNLIHMYNVLENGINEAESIITLYTIQNPEPKWFDFFKLMGMKILQK